MSGCVIILTGPPGAGKSTLARALAHEQQRSVHLHTDDFWHSIVSGAVPPYEPGAEAQNQTVLGVVASAAYLYALGGFTTIVDGIVGPWMLHHFRAWRARHPEVPLRYVVLRPDRSVTLARAQSRTAVGSLAAAAPVLGMWDQFAELDLLEGHVLDTSRQNAEESLDAVRTAVRDDRYLLGPSPDPGVTGADSPGAA